MKEAINLYEETLHRMRMENAVIQFNVALQQMQYDLDAQMSQINNSLDRANSRLQDIETMEWYRIISNS